ncbi:MAG: GNAT family N-acetyltransferase [Chloroflexi bacterium]|nr:GNAT family N-acetyltransferase [Chloroflexota bacterium]
MPTIEIKPAQTARERHIFLTFPWKIYRRDPLWVPPLLPDRRKAIDPRRGVFFRRGGEAEFFIAWRSSQPVGTICCAVDHPSNRETGLQESVFGFFECIDDEDVARALFDHAAAWARQRGLRSITGPFHLDYEDSYGVLIEGRDRPPAILCGHTPAYYQAFFESYGFTPSRGDNIAFALDLNKPSPALERLAQGAQRAREQGHFIVRAARFTEWEAEIDRVHPLINAALAHLPDHRPWPREALQESFAPFKQIADPDLILFVEVQGKVVGFFPGVPNLNEALIHANGLRYPWNYLQLAWWMRQPVRCLAVKSVLVYPEYWSSGASLLLFDEMLTRARARGYWWADLSLTSTDNPKTPMLAERLGAKIYKRYRVYRLEV